MAWPRSGRKRVDTRPPRSCRLSERARFFVGGESGTSLGCRQARRFATRWAHGRLVPSSDGRVSGKAFGRSGRPQVLAEDLRDAGTLACSMYLQDPAPPRRRP